VSKIYGLQQKPLVWLNKELLAINVQASVKY
jgi:hypothetical protein